MLPFRQILLSVWLARVLFYSCVLAGCALAFLPTDSSIQPDMNDKLAHSASFFILAFLFHLAHPTMKVWQYLAVLMLLGIFIEVMQAMLPYRNFDWLDWLADVSGSALYFLCFYVLTLKFILSSRSSLD